MQSFLKVFRKPLCIARRTKRFKRDDTRSLMMPVPILPIPLKPRDDDIGTEQPNETHHILQQHLLIPLLQRLVQPFRIAEIYGTAVKELDAVIARRD